MHYRLLGSRHLCLRALKVAPLKQRGDDNHQVSGVPRALWKTGPRINRGEFSRGQYSLILNQLEYIGNLDNSLDNLIGVCNTRRYVSQITSGSAPRPDFW
jgi:hypothetical protein